MSAYGQPPPPGNQGYYQGHPAPGPGQPSYDYSQGHHAPPPPPGGQTYQGYGQPPPGQYGQQPPPPQQYHQQAPPPAQQPPYGQPPPHNQGQYPPPQQPYQGYNQQPPPPGQHPPPAAGYGQPQHQGYPPPGQPQGYAGQPPQQYPPQQYPPQQQPPYGYGAPPAAPAPASPGYDVAQRQWIQQVDTAHDTEALRKAMKGMGCDEKALIKVLTDPKYGSSPWTIMQLKEDYNKRFVRHLEKDIESETRGDFETALLALIRGPLENDARVLEKALVRAGTDEDALVAVLIGRSNADIRAITAEYKRIHGRELLVDIKEDVKDDMYRLYSMILAANRPEDSAPVVEYEIDQKVTELQRATEGTIGVNAAAVAHIFTSSNNAQIHAICAAYQRKYHRALRDVLEDEFRGDMEKILLTMLEHATDRARCDAVWLHEPMFETVRKDRLVIHRMLMLYWDKPRMTAARAAYRSRYRSTLRGDVVDRLSGDYEKLMLRLMGEK